MGVFFDPADQLYADEVGNACAVAQWILRNVPSFVGRIPAMWTDGVIRELRKRGVRDDVISAALWDAHAYGHKFEETDERRKLPLRPGWGCALQGPPRVPLPIRLDPSPSNVNPPRI